MVKDGGDNLTHNIQSGFSLSKHTRDLAQRQQVLSTDVIVSRSGPLTPFSYTSPPFSVPSNSPPPLQVEVGSSMVFPFNVHVPPPGQPSTLPFSVPFDSPPQFLTVSAAQGHVQVAPTYTPDPDLNLPELDELDAHLEELFGPIRWSS